MAEQILNYQIIKKIGEGGMGSVFLAQHTQLDRKAAVKALHPTLVNNPHIRERFKNEASTMAHLKHPSIVSLYDYMEAPNGLFLIMEYIEGRPLDEYITQISGPISEEKTIAFFTQILDGFDYAHNKGVIHRDIKPSNLIITPEDEVKILDFGIAKLLGNDNKALTQAGSRMGTVLYMSPEQVKGSNIDLRSDIYALGVTLFQMLTGKGPYPAQGVTEYEVYNKIVNEPLPKVQNISPKMQEIINKATAKNPDERFQNCQEFQKALLGNASRVQDKNNYQYSSLENTQLDQVQGIKKTKNKTGLYITLTLVLLLLAGAFVVVFVNPFQIKALEKVAFLQAKDSKKEKLIEHLKAYYKALETQNFEQIKPFFEDNIEKYFTYENITFNQDVKPSLRFAWKKYELEKIEIDEEIEYEEDEDGNFTIVFDYVYKYKEPEKEEKTVNRKGEIKLNKDLKVYYVNNLN